MADANLLQIVGAAKAFASKILFEDASFAVNENEHIGLIGPNGAGKTTLLKVIAGQTEFDSGTVIRAQKLRVGYLEQESDWNTDENVEECLLRLCTMPIWDVKREARGLGLFDEHFAAPLKSLSGGYRMRVRLLALLGQEPNLLMLDEPTNFLDLETVLVLERFLQGYKGAFLLISHDREFLRRTTDHIVEVEAGQITKYPGQIDDYFEQKALIREQLERAAQSQQQKRAAVLEFAQKFGAKATKARQAQSRLKSLERMEVIEIKPLPVRARIPIPPPVRTGKEVVRIEHLSCGYNDRQILGGVNMVLERGHHLGIVGLNGAGKSTLLKTIGDALPALGGSMKFGMNVKTALFSQHSTDQLVMEETVFQSLSRAAHPEVPKQEILGMAGALLFSGDDIEKKVRVLSGGEKTRVALGQVLLSKASLLLLDEPTNHLDFDTVEALTSALAEFEGSLITVSHDRSFIRRIATKVLEVHDGVVTLYPGTYDDYVWSLQKGVLSERGMESSAGIKKSGGQGKSAPGGVSGVSATTVSSASSDTPAQASERRARLKVVESEIRRLEKSVPSLEKKTTEKTKQRDDINQKLVTAGRDEIGPLVKEMQEVTLRIEHLEEQLLQEMEQLENLQAERKQLRGE